MILTTRGGGVKFPHLYRPSLICAPDFILIEITSNLHSKLLDPQFDRIPIYLTRFSKCREHCTERETPGVAKKLQKLKLVRYLQYPTNSPSAE